jgi:hypothetical protein
LDRSKLDRSKSGGWRRSRQEWICRPASGRGVQRLGVPTSGVVEVEPAASPQPSAAGVASGGRERGRSRQVTFRDKGKPVGNPGTQSHGPTAPAGTGRCQGSRAAERKAGAFRDVAAWEAPCHRLVGCGPPIVPVRPQGCLAALTVGPSDRHGHGGTRGSWAHWHGPERFLLPSWPSRC